ncbi:alkaline phosphatase [Candidatus Wolfebacteria bacterium CG10_big_fil_rev_8_21_14_0_10_31_9]|uniref:Alkaline phosphatase n=1 Tax=Candidatus Wolfebacteria bacterium CG10_big_fil_rev_8_21_14_0_10_31_9 TaxID=1975070 RepID=A0A2H0RC63_9BACT|nr:MAG: alkaline phosphatase [Candidatus Wolfebacteria bacterium CG10_big_fil_rev_8_21_14_0_10_31_9]
MFSLVLTFISSLILLIIQKIGYAGIFVLMLLQSVNIPIPSEITMLFSGFLAFSGVFNFWTVVFIGASGNLFGAYLSYKLAESLVMNDFRNKPLIRILINDKSLAIAQEWFKKYGAFSVFFSRMVPVMSTFISFPAGMAKMRLDLFLTLTFLGSLIWSFILTKMGFILGENWTVLHVYFRQFDYIILTIIVLVGAFFIWKHSKKNYK